MKSILYDTKPTIRQMYLDPRTKILLCVTVSFVMIASDNTGVMRYVLPCMALIPLAAFIILKKYAIAAYYAVLYMISIILPDYAMEHFPAIVNILFTGIIAIFTKILPGMSMFSFLILTTTVSEFVAAMDSLHIPKSFTIPVSVMFRFFPTIKEEYSAICVVEGIVIPQIDYLHCLPPISIVVDWRIEIRGRRPAPLLNRSYIIA